ncbi:MAG: hypothetical protein AB8B48_09150 [Pseudomonadales bacterium]
MSESANQQAINNEIKAETRKNIVINLVLNGLIAYFLMRQYSSLSAWGENGYGPDLLITGFILSAILGAIFIGVFRRKRERGELTPGGETGQSLAWLLPYNPWLAALLMGILGALIAAPILLAILALLGVESLQPLHYALIKGVWAGMLAGAVVPIAIKQGLRRPHTE